MTLGSVDIAVLVLYNVLALGSGFWFARSAGRSSEHFFTAGRNLHWFVSGTSMAATTFAADTPLAITGFVAGRGLWANWIWWSSVANTVLAVIAYAPYWRVSEVLTDLELCELRYSGQPAKYLRGLRAIYSGLLFNCFVLGWVILAMQKIVMQVFDLSDTASWGPFPVKVAVVLLCLLVSGIYASISGFVGVVKTDVVQFFLAVGTSAILAGLAVADLGGVAALRAKLDAKCPDSSAVDIFPKWSATGEDTWRFILYISLVWICSKQSDGSGYLAQRMISCKDEYHAKKASAWFNVLNYVARPWPWILVALVAVVKFGNTNCTGDDPESWYPRLMVEYLSPHPGLLGLALAGMFAAFMSTVDTHLNWASSYLVHDVYRRFIDPDAPESRIVLLSRLCVLATMVLSGITSLFLNSVSTAWELMVLAQGSIGIVYLVRWHWWRINAWSELSAMISGLIASVIAAATLDVETQYAWQIFLVASLSTFIWVSVTLFTGPEDPATLDKFYCKVRPVGFWGPVASRVSLFPPGSQTDDVVELDDSSDDTAQKSDEIGTIADSPQAERCGAVRKKIHAKCDGYGTLSSPSTPDNLKTSDSLRRNMLDAILKWLIGCLSLFGLMFGVGEFVLGMPVAGALLLTVGVCASTWVGWRLHHRSY